MAFNFAVLFALWTIRFIRYFLLAQHFSSNRDRSASYTPAEGRRRFERLKPNAFSGINRRTIGATQD
jgi:hypothetical protein